MVIVVHLHTTLQQSSAGNLIRQVKLTLPSEATLAEVLINLGITMPIDSLLLVINGRLADLDHELYDGDVVHLIPALSGG